MSESIKQQVQSDLKEKISSLYSYIHKHENKNLEKKLQQLAEKTVQNEFSIAFCGHFSAGKSTMINRLIGENILPSSPIPTSANLVKVKTGEEYAKVYFKNEKPRLYLPPYDYEQVKNYCKDGDQIEWVEISHADSNLPKGMVILDTPGIDSTDDAHRIATESALHLSDLIFYVMDYNHVQSEVNFLFTKDLTLAGKEIYLVINQIDKHRDAELSMESFKMSVEESFASWGVTPKGIFYTSLKDSGNPHNQFEELQSFVYERIHFIETHLNESLMVSVKQLANEYLGWLRDENAEEETKAIELLESLSNEEQTDMAEQNLDIQQKLNSIEETLLQIEKEFYNESEKIVKNAYLMPFQTRELAEKFLEANQEGFKVGFLFSKQKTETERLERLNLFFEDLAEKVSSQLDWHIRAYLGQLLKNYAISDNVLQAQCQNYQTPFSKDVLLSNVKSGAILSGEYLLNYTNDIVNDITRSARKKLMELSDSLISAIKEKQSENSKRLKNQLEKIRPYIDAKEFLNKLNLLYVNEKKTIDEILNGTRTVTSNEDLFIIKEEEVEVVKGGTSNNIKKQEIEMVEVEVPSTEETKKSTISKEKLVSRLKRTASELEELTGFKQTAKDLLEKANRIENQGFTVALFGAFSAGKSSFANALMGGDVLPVSPNPTTAAINKILPVTATFPHGSVRVKLKDPDQLMVEVIRSLKVFDLHADSFDTALMNIEKIISQSKDFIGNEKIHFSFLHAFLKGFSDLSSSLGGIIQTDMESFREFVANETKSCFVEWIELYYDCELTRKGITLVDTPGADSINARHTGVAFDYIKNSDAILFVTYYNHAFSKADREFLIQLGRVKDTFELDKMFFIINAIDLANNEEELQSVKSYVSNQLTAYGIRNPHLFALSSLLALKEKQQQNLVKQSNMDHFEENFYHFISDDLLKTTLVSAESELQRVIHDIRVLIQAANEDDAKREERRKSLLVEKNEAVDLLSKQNVSHLEQRVSQELKELLFYIKQRVFLRFNDFFKESFNPSVLKEDGRNMKKALNASLEELLISVGYDFAQELRATSLRMDAYLRKVLGEYHQMVNGSLQEKNADINISLIDFQQERKLEFKNAFEQLNPDMFQKVLATFKNPKSFFEKNEKKKMSDELYELLQNPAEGYIQNEGVKLNSLYLEILNESFAVLISQASLDIETFYDRLLASLDNKGLAEELSKVLERLED
jgi:small GTP-binding protein